MVPSVIKSVAMLLRDAARDFMRHDDMSLSAALAFYAALSLSPLLIIIISVAGLLGPETRLLVIGQIEILAGRGARDVLEIVIDNIGGHYFAGGVSAAAGLLMLAFSGTSVFMHLQKALNRIWEVQSTRGEIRTWIEKRVLSMGMVIAVGAVIMASILISQIVSLLFSGIGFFWLTVNSTVTIIVYMLLFAMIYRYIPDVHIGWGDVWLGAVVTAFLFSFGKYGLNRYLSRVSIGSAYGAAGSLVVLLVWVYFSSIAVFFGAEITRAYTVYFSSHLRPKKSAEWIGDKRNQDAK